MDAQMLADMLGLGPTKKVRGKGVMVCCPFHHEKTPSFLIDEKGNYHCFGGCDDKLKDGSWVRLYSLLKFHSEEPADYRKAYEELGMNRDFHYEKKEHRVQGEKVDVSLVGEPKGEDRIQLAYNATVSIIDSPAEEWIKSKKLETIVEDLGWRWSVKSKQIIIPNFEKGEIVSARVRRLGEKTKALPSNKYGPPRPLYYFLESQDTVLFCEGETSTATAVLSGYSAVGIPGAGNKACINTAVCVSANAGYKTVIGCGDNDDAGREMNRLIKCAIQNFGTKQKFIPLPMSVIGEEENLNTHHDLNDALAEGNLALKDFMDKVLDPLAGAIPLTGWESIYAQVLFSTKEEAYNLIAEELEKHPGDTPAETKFLADMFSADLSTMKRLWAANPPLQQKYLWYKDCMKEVQAK